MTLTMHHKVRFRVVILLSNSNMGSFVILTIKAGDSWYYGFRKRHSGISVRAPEKTSLARRVLMRGSKRLLYHSKSFTADRIWNTHEKGISTVPNHPPKILARNSKKQIEALLLEKRVIHYYTSPVWIRSTGYFITVHNIFISLQYIL